MKLSIEFAIKILETNNSSNSFQNNIRNRARRKTMTHRWMMLGEIVSSSKIPLVPRLSTRNPRQTFLTDINIFLLGTIVGQQYVGREKEGRRHCPGN